MRQNDNVVFLERDMKDFKEALANAALPALLSSMGRLLRTTESYSFFEETVSRCVEDALDEIWSQVTDCRDEEERGLLASLSVDQIHESVRTFVAAAKCFKGGLYEQNALSSAWTAAERMAERLVGVESMLSGALAVPDDWTEAGAHQTAAAQSGLIGALYLAKELLPAEQRCGVNAKKILTEVINDVFKTSERFTKTGVLLFADLSPRLAPRLLDASFSNNPVCEVLKEFSVPQARTRKPA